jgi:hypothetical protein
MFGRGRGRGGRGAPPGAVLRDDEGNVMAAAAPGPPLLFPVRAACAACFPRRRMCAR